MLNVILILVVVNATLVEAGKAWKIIIDPQADQRSPGLIAQLVEHCNSSCIAEDRVPVPFQPDFLGLTRYFNYNYMDLTLKITSISSSKR